MDHGQFFLSMTDRLHDVLIWQTKLEYVEARKAVARRLSSP